MESYNVSGDYILFGTYEQDGDESNGAEPIEWEVLGEDENGILVISRFLLDAIPYNTQRKNVTWETCTLRAWLNSVFYDEAFSDSDKLRINTVIIANADNSEYGTDGGNDTEDNVFCLSVDEVMKYYEFYYDEDYDYLSPWCERLIVAPTIEAEESGVITYILTEDDYEDNYKERGYSVNCIGSISGQWWLRSPGCLSNTAYMIWWGGVMSAEDYETDIVSVDNYYVGVRPALYLKKSS